PGAARPPHDGGGTRTQRRAHRRRTGLTVSAHMHKQQVNPWTWQDAAGFSQAWRVDGAGSIVFVSGQAPISADGQLVGEDDFEAQVRQAFENLQTVLEQAGAGLEAVVKLTLYLTDMTRLRDDTRIKGE